MEQSAYTISIPLLNPNEPEAKVVSLAVQEGQFVRKNTILCTLETTKSTADVVAEVDGYITALQISVSDYAQAGSLLCYLAESQDWRPDLPDSGSQDGIEPESTEDMRIGIPSGLRISQPALKLANANTLDLAVLPIGPLVTESIVKEFIEQPSALSTEVMELDPRALIVYGGGGHGKSVIDLIRSHSAYRIHGVVDDGLNPDDQVLGIPVLGGSEVLPELHSLGIRQAVNAVGGIGDIKSRIKVFHLIAENGFICPTVVHSSAVVETSAEISQGVQVFSQAYVGSEASLGFGVIINTGAVVSHDCTLDDFVNISPGALLAGGVKIGQGTLIGMGVTINLGVSVGEKVRIGNGATIKSHVPDGSLVKAGTIWPD